MILPVIAPLVCTYMSQVSREDYITKAKHVASASAASDATASFTCLARLAATRTLTLTFDFAPLETPCFYLHLEHNREGLEKRKRKYNNSRWQQTTGGSIMTRGFHICESWLSCLV